VLAQVGGGGLEQTRFVLEKSEAKIAGAAKQITDVFSVMVMIDA
jgi:hypothetical protein